MKEILIQSLRLTQLWLVKIRMILKQATTLQLRVKYEDVLIVMIGFVLIAWLGIDVMNVKRSTRKLIHQLGNVIDAIKSFQVTYTAQIVIISVAECTYVNRAGKLLTTKTISIVERDNPIKVISPSLWRGFLWLNCRVNEIITACHFELEL